MIAAIKNLMSSTGSDYRLSNWAALAAVILVSLTHVQAADPASTRKSVVVLGDSLAAGLGVDPDQAFPSLLQRKIDSAGLSFAVVNAGVSGDTSAGGLRRIDWLLQRKIDVLILELGGNDGLRGIPVSATLTNLQGIVDRVKHTYPEARIVLAGMQIPSNMGEEYTAAFKNIYPDLAEKNRTALIPFLLDGVAGRRDLNQNDRIHPTAEGHKVVADNVWKVLKPLLQETNSPPKL